MIRGLIEEGVMIHIDFGDGRDYTVMAVKEGLRVEIGDAHCHCFRNLPENWPCNVCTDSMAMLESLRRRTGSDRVKWLGVTGTVILLPDSRSLNFRWYVRWDRMHCRGIEETLSELFEAKGELHPGWHRAELESVLPAEADDAQKE